MSAVIYNLGIDDKIIDNLNLIKFWQLEVAAQRVLKRFISSREIRGSALVEISGVLNTVGSMGTEEEKFTILSPYEKPSK